MAQWDDIKNLALEEELPPPIVAAEPMQIAFLDGLYGETGAVDIVFHGGTAIRLLHGGYRYSEDLDFCVPPGKTAESLDSLVQKAYGRAKELISLYLGDAQTELKKKEGRKKIATWWFNILPHGERQKYRVKIEFGTYPAYSKQSIPLKVKNKFLPRQPVLVSADAKELLADKINALADRPYTKERDFFDVWYLTTVLNAQLDVELLNRKFLDYHVMDSKNILKRRLKELDAVKIAESMAYFLPVRYRRLLSQNDYREIVDVCYSVMNDALKHLQK